MGMTPRSSQVDLDAAVEAVIAGASYGKAEALTGVPASTVREYVVRWGFVRRNVPQGAPRGLSTGCRYLPSEQIWATSVWP